MGKNKNGINWDYVCDLRLKCINWTLVFKKEEDVKKYYE